jgi:hypothetical protein
MEEKDDYSPFGYLPAWGLVAAAHSGRYKYQREQSQECVGKEDIMHQKEDIMHQKEDIMHQKKGLACFSLRLPQEVAQALQQVAIQHDRSVNREITYALRSWVRQHMVEDGPVRAGDGVVRLMDAS